MTRDDAIRTIAANLARLKDEELATIAEVTSAWVGPQHQFELSSAERAAVERSFADFDAGRTLSLDEAEARTAAHLAARRAARQQS